MFFFLIVVALAAGASPLFKRQQLASQISAQENDLAEMAKRLSSLHVAANEKKGDGSRGISWNASVAFDESRMAEEVEAKNANLSQRLSTIRVDLEHLNFTVLPSLRHERQQLDDSLVGARSRKVEMRKEFDKTFAKQQRLFENRQLLLQRSGWLNRTALKETLRIGLMNVYDREGGLGDLWKKRQQLKREIFGDFVFPTFINESEAERIGSNAARLAFRFFKSANRTATKIRDCKSVPVYFRARPNATVALILLAPVELVVAVRLAATTLRISVALFTFPFRATSWFLDFVSLATTLALSLIVYVARLDFWNHLLHASIAFTLLQYSKAARKFRPWTHPLKNY